MQDQAQSQAAGESSDQRVRFGPLWNIGCKVTEIAPESEFLQRIGARLRLHEELPGPTGPLEYEMLEFGGTRIFLTRKPVFEDALGYDLRPGLTHGVFEVEDHDAACAAALRAGARQLTEARIFEAGFGKRRVAFFQSPGGLVFEALKIIEARI